MADIPYEIIPGELAARAVSLVSEGVADVGWSRDDALRVIHLARGAKIGLLGGEVWTKRKGRWRAGPESWACDVQEGESLEAFAARSCEQAEAYVTTLPEPRGEMRIYSLVFASRTRFQGHHAMRLRDVARRELSRFDRRLAHRNMRWSPPELHEWETEGQYNAQLRITIRRE
jgi:Immunity protein 40